MESYDVLIIGAGAAGYVAGLYAARYNLKTLIIGKEPGGLTNEAYVVDNYPGFKEIPGSELMNKFKEHAESFGAKITSFVDVVEIKKAGNSFTAKTESGEKISAKAIIFASGTKKRRLGVEGEERLMGRGVSYCATCDGPFFKDKVVAVVGGGNSAVTSAIMLTEYAKKVYLIHRRSEFRAVPVWVEKAKNNKKIELVLNATVQEILGKDTVEKIRIRQNGKDKELGVNGIFIEIGSVPNSDLARSIGVEVDERGYIKVNMDMSTNVEGVYAAGDVTTGSNGFEQIITASAEGAIAAESVFNYIKRKGY
ncbi:MAG TPA: thioredoxin-disulfide reductase [Candidatus Aenigmarchaeota archaeon]|nr:MAG: thioredoxin-disulfide reductase [Candidatus Aenigmarchaeota archaeon]HDD46346.1 thioredoxin-disulfide reductase [Candidatus Aenigmarchaeota archaeon]